MAFARRKDLLLTRLIAGSFRESLPLIDLQLVVQPFLEVLKHRSVLLHDIGRIDLLGWDLALKLLRLTFMVCHAVSRKRNFLRTLSLCDFSILSDIAF